MTRILLTGATGFVGRHIMNSLGLPSIKLLPVVRSGKEYLVDRLQNVEKVISTPNLFGENCEWWAKQCIGVDLIIHCAWYAEPGKYLEASENLDCTIGSLELAKGAAIAGVNRFVGIGTCFEYDLNSHNLSIDTPLKPLTTYAASKAALFGILSAWFSVRSIQFSWCRLFYIYGDGEDERRLVPYIRQCLKSGDPALLTSGKQIRDYLDVLEVSKRIVSVALSDKLGPVNICSGIGITVKELAEKIAAEYGREDLLRFGARPDNLIDPQCVVGIPND